MLFFSATIAACAQINSSQSHKPSSVTDPQIISAAGKITKKIESNLYVKPSDKKLNEKIRFRLDEKARISSYVVLKSSGNKNFDASVRQAVYKSFPMPELTKLDKNVYKQLQDITLNISPV